MAWAGIRAAIQEMLTDAGYVVRGTRGVAEAADRYITIIAENEENLDTGNMVGVNQFRNRRDFTLWVFNKSKVGVTDIDAVVQAAQGELEPVLQDLKRIFGSTYNKVGDAGAVMLMYKGMRFKNAEASGVYAPVRMEVTFSVQYFESRHIT